MARQPDPYRNFKYEVVVSGYGTWRFSSVSGLSRSIEEIEYREGGDPETPRKVPGQTTFENIVCERGKGTETTFLDWINQIYNPSTAPTNTNGENFRRTIFIYLIDRMGNKVRQWRAVHCWPSKYEHDDLSGDGNDIFIERLEIAHEGLSELKL